MFVRKSVFNSIDGIILFDEVHECDRQPDRHMDLCHDGHKP